MAKHHKITNGDLSQMRALQKQGLTLTTIGERFGCSKYRVHRILTGKAKKAALTPSLRWTETEKVKELLHKSTSVVLKDEIPQVRQKRSGVRPRREMLDLAELDMALSTWLRKRGLLDLSYREYWGGRIIDKHENTT